MTDTSSMEDFATAVGGLHEDPVGSDGGSEQDLDQDDGETRATTPKLSAFATNYLANVPEEEHDLVIRHISEWDKGFQNFAQRVAAERSQYQQLGSLEELQQKVTVADMIANDPVGVTQWLIDQGYSQKEAVQAVSDQMQATRPQAGQQQTDPYGNLPQAVREKLAKVDQFEPQMKRYETALGAMYQNLQQKEQEAEVAEATKTLEAELSDAHKRFGDFDEYLVLLQMREGIPLDEAVTKISGLVQNQVNQRAAPQAPRVMSSRSLPPQQKAVSDMSDDERISALAQLVQGTMG